MFQYYLEKVFFPKSPIPVNEIWTFNSGFHLPSAFAKATARHVRVPHSLRYGETRRRDASGFRRYFHIRKID